ncbi:MAG: glycosyltransferase [Armatimonadota bacterium]
MNRNICIISPSYPPRICGIADYTYMLSNHLSSSGCNINIITSTQNASGDNVKHIDNNWDNRTINEAIRIISEIKPEVVHIQYQAGLYNHNPELLLLPPKLKKMGIKSVATYHDLNGPALLGKLSRFALLLFMTRCNINIVCSFKQLSAVRRIPFIKNKVVQIPVGAVVDPIPYNKNNNLNSPPLILHFGFIWRDRGLESLVDACIEVKKNYGDIQLVFAGGIVDKSYPAEIKKRANVGGLNDDNIIFTDALENNDLSKLIHQSDICVLPFPTGASHGRSTLATCAIHKKPIITTYVKDNCPKEFIHKQNIMLYNPDNIKELTDNIISLLKNDKLRKYISNEIDNAMSSSKWENIANAHIALYEKL